MYREASGRRPGRHRRQPIDQARFMSKRPSAVGTTANAGHRPFAELSTRVRCQHDHLGADPHTIVKIDHVVIDHSNTAGGNVAPNLPGLVCAMNAVQGVLVALPQVKRAGTEWTVGTSG